jgi:hypothetical protein
VKTIAEFLIELSRNEDLRAQFESDPRAAAEAFGVEGPTLDLLLSGQLKNIRIKAEADLVVEGETVSFFTIWWFRKDAD